MSILNPREPLGLPAGSVRALIALILTVTLAVVVLRSSIVIDAKDFGTIILLVLGFYFLVKAATAGRGQAE